MQSTEIPQLHPQVTVHRIDAEVSAAFLVNSPEGKRWIVSEGLGHFLQLLDGTRSLHDLQRSLDSGECGELTGCSAEETITRTAKQYGLLQNCREMPIKKKRSALLEVPLFDSAHLHPISHLFSRLVSWPALIAVLMGNMGLQALVYVGVMHRSLRHPDHIGFTQCCLLAIVLTLSVCLHELGHIAACDRYGCKAGSVGVGLYLIFPVIWVDLQEAIYLKRSQRMMVDASGIYFQCVPAIIVALIALCARSQFLGFTAFAVTVMALSNLNPLLKMDGYWFLSDYLGIPNLHSVARQAVYARARQHANPQKFNIPGASLRHGNAMMVEALGWLHIAAILWVVVLIARACITLVYGIFHVSILRPAVYGASPTYTPLSRVLLDSRIDILIGSALFVSFQLLLVLMRSLKTKRSCIPQ